jgi:hypothetical protein
MLPTEFSEYLELSRGLYADAVKARQIPTISIRPLGGVFLLAANDAFKLREIEAAEDDEHDALLGQRAVIQWESRYEQLILDLYYAGAGDWELALETFFARFGTEGHTLDELRQLSIPKVISAKGDIHPAWMTQPLRHKRIIAGSKAMMSANGLPAAVYLIASGNVGNPSLDALETANTIAESGIMDALEGFSTALTVRGENYALRMALQKDANRATNGRRTRGSRGTPGNDFESQRGTGKKPPNSATEDAAPAASSAPTRPKSRARKRYRALRPKPTSAGYVDTPRAYRRGNVAISPQAAWETVKPMLSASESAAAQRLIGQFPALPRAIWRQLVLTFERRMMSQLAQLRDSPAYPTRARELAAERFGTALQAFWFSARLNDDLVKMFRNAGLTMLPSVEVGNPVLGANSFDARRLAASTGRKSSPPVWQLPDGSQPALQIVHRDPTVDPWHYLSADHLMFAVVPTLDSSYVQRLVNPFAAQLQGTHPVSIPPPASE